MTETGSFMAYFGINLETLWHCSPHYATPEKAKQYVAPYCQ